MKYLLDTNICVHFLRGRFGVIDKFLEIGTENFAISEITFAELVFGAENSSNPKKNLKLIEVFTNQIVILLIGCTAVDRDMVLVTENLKEFERISGIKIENWVKR